MSNQGARQASVRAVTGTAFTYEGDWHALFDLDGVAAGSFNGRLLAWINQNLGTSYSEINGAMNAFAIDQGYSDWNSMGTFTVSPIPLRTVVSQNRVQSGKEARTNKDRQCFRYPFYIAQDCSEIVLAFAGTVLEGTGQNGVLNDYTIEGFAIEIGGSYALGSFDGGSASKVITNLSEKVLSDPIYPSAFGLSEFAYGTQIWVRGIASVPTRGTDRLPYTQTSTSHITGSQAAWWDSTLNTVSTIAATGTFTISGGSFDNRTNGVRPMVLGRPLSDGLSFVTTGDSIAETVNDGAPDIPNNDPLKIHGIGFIQRSVRETDNSDVLPMINLARSATRSFDVSGGTYAKQYFEYARFGIDEYGTNNMPAAGASLSPLQDSLQIIWDDMRTAGVEKIIRTKYLPRTTSTDNYTTVANQTYFTNWAPGDSPDLMDDWFDTLVGTDLDVVTTSSGVKSPSDPNKWLTDTPETTANYTAADTTHPAWRGHEFLAVELRPLMRAL